MCDLVTSDKVHYVNCHTFAASTYHRTTYENTAR